MIMINYLFESSLKFLRMFSSDPMEIRIRVTAIAPRKPSCSYTYMVSICTGLSMGLWSGVLYSAQLSSVQFSSAQQQTADYLLSAAQQAQNRQQLLAVCYRLCCLLPECSLMCCEH